MNKDTLETMATSAFANATRAQADLFEAAEMAIEAKLNLETQKAQAMTGGVIKATNDKGRDAEMRLHLEAEYLKLEQAEKLERRARHEMALTSIDVDTVKTLLRIAELP